MRQQVRRYYEQLGIGERGCIAARQLAAARPKPITI